MEEKYEVIHSFKDLKDNEHIYHKDIDFYPREGLKPTKKRIEALETDKNKIGVPLIRKIDTEEKIESKEEQTEKEMTEDTVEEKLKETSEEINTEVKTDE